MAINPLLSQMLQSEKPEAPPSKLDGFLTSPGGSLLVNLLSQSGFSTMPQSPFGAIGKGLLATQQQSQGRERNDLTNQLLRSQIGLNEAKASAAPPGVGPLTEIAKLQEDLNNGRISPDIFEAKSNEILNKEVNDRFDNTQKLRGEFTSETKDIAKSLQSLSAAESLIQKGDTPNSVAQLAAFISTIKSIDNSTVREGELRAFESVQGFMRSLENQISRAKGEGFTVDLQSDIADTITRLKAPLSELLNAKKLFFSEEAERSRLNPISITGSPFSKVSDEPVVKGVKLPSPDNKLTNAAIADGVPQEEWDVMTPEQRALYAD